MSYSVCVYISALIHVCGVGFSRELHGKTPSFCQRDIRVELKWKEELQ